MILIAQGMLRMTHQLHDQLRGDVDGHARERVLNHQSRADFVDGERFEAVLEDTEVLQPAEDGRDVTEVHDYRSKVSALA